MKKVLWVGLLALVSLTVLGWNVCWRSPPFFTAYGDLDLPVSIMTMEEYGEVIAAHPRPYVVEAATRTGALLLYGGEHTRDPQDEQIPDLRKRWADFEPTVALVEGRLGFLIEGLQDPVEQFGEGGAVFSLARAAGVPAYSWEPPRSLEVRAMLREFDKEKVALFFVLRPYFSNFQHGKPSAPNAFVEPYRLRRTAWAGLEGTLDSVARIDAVWERDFPGNEDWRDTTDAHGLPGYLGKMYARSNAVRDEHLARVIIHLVRKGHRVFAVAGCSHAVKLERTLRAALAH